MLKKRFLKFVTTLVCIVTLIMPHASVVLATALTNKVPTSANYINDVKLKSISIHQNGKAYKLGDTDVLKIIKLQEKAGDNWNDVSDENQYEDTFYCLDSSKNFPSYNHNDGIEYSRTTEDFFSSSDNKALLWLYTAMSLRREINDSVISELKQKAFDNMNVSERPDTADEIDSEFLNADNVDVIQQWAIWHYTNSKDFPNVIKLSDGLGNETTLSETENKEQYRVLKGLYTYYINFAEANKTKTVSYPTIKNKENITVTTESDKYKVGPFEIENEGNIPTTVTITDHDGNVIPSDKYEISGNYIYVPVENNTISEIKYNISYNRTKASGWTSSDDDNQPLVLITKELEEDYVEVELPNIQPDLALRKYIVKVNNTEIDRNVSVETTALKNNSRRTADYYGKKSAVEVKPGDTVTFRIEVFNEGNVDAKATEIIDYLPAGLDFITDNETNETYNWAVTDGKLTTDYLKNKTIPAFDKEDGEKGKISSKYVELVCKVADDNNDGKVLTNIAEIMNDNVEDRDSNTDSVKTEVDLNNTDNYTGKDNDEDLSKTNYYYKGQQDDDDFEKIVVRIPKFDLSLQKFITKVNGKEVKTNREPVVDTAPLKNNKNNATYTTPKEKLKVQIGDVVTYKIRVYNEGEVDGYAERVSDYLPEGLGYLVDYKANNDNNWSYPEDAETIKLSDIKNGTKKLKTSDFKNIENLDDVKVVKGKVKLESNKLSSSDNNNLIKAFDGSEKLSYKDIEVTCVVLSDANLKNIAEVVEDKDKNKNDVEDRDSTPDTVNPDDYPNCEKNPDDDLTQDDHDYEELITVEFDLALQKFISKLNNTTITDREPEFKYEDGKFTYTHPQTPLQVKNGDKVTYTLRVYNEGPTAGYAAEIKDNIPSGLKFDPENETNKKYGWKMYDENKNETTDSSKAVEIRTDYLSLEKAEERGEDALLNAFNTRNNEISAKDVQVVFTVDTKSFDRAIVNIAEITRNTDEDGEDIPDIDSEPDNGDETEDDLDKERVIVDPFDLSLQKFITKINGKEVKTSREPKVDTTPLKNGKRDATYTTIKNPVVVEVGDIVTYKIRVYNEGKDNGYAETVADYLPEGLGYLVNYNTNIDNYWALPTDLSSNNTVKLSTIKNGTKNVKTTDFTGVTDLANVDVVKGSVKLTSTALSSSKTDNLLKAFDGSDKLYYKDIEVTCIVLADSNLKNIAEVTKNLDEDKKEVIDVDSTPDTVDPNNYPGDDINQDDNDYEVLTVENKKFDLALQKFITAVNGKTISGREPKPSYENGKISYTHTATPLEVNTGDSITYSLRVYNEGDIAGYAAEIGDDIPAGLTFDANNETNKKYGWKMYDADGKVTTDASKAKEIRTDYLSKEKSESRKESSLLNAFNSISGDLYYLDVQAVFTVSVKSADTTVINTAEITKDTDENGKEIEDIDSTPDNKKDGEDDIDKERIHVGYFDLALVKDLKKAIVTVDGKTKEVDATDGKLKKIEINRKKINSTVVKFVYTITIKNEGTIPGYAKEITDYIPEGLEFVQEDNKAWTQKKDVIITTESLANTLIKPGEAVSVEVVLRWKNGENNLGLKTNVAEISKDYNEANDTDDIDSTPNNKKDGEDDIDDAPVILSISTGKAQMYIILSTAVLMIISTGVVVIKKYVLNK